MKRWLLSAVLLAAQGALAKDRALLQLFDTLLANGTITREQYDRLVAVLKAEPKEKTSPKTASGSNVKVTLNKKGLRFHSQDDQFKFKAGGRLHVHAGYHDQDRIVGQQAGDGTFIRRGRIHFKGTLYKDWKFTAMYEFGGNEVGIKDLFLEYRGLKRWLGVPLTVAVGHLKQPYSLEIEMSSNDMPFLERSIATEALLFPVVDRSVGLRLESHGKHWFFAGTVAGDTDFGSNQVEDEGWGVTGRLILAPLRSEDRLVHLGLRGAYRQPDDAGSVLKPTKGPIRFRGETTYRSGLYLVDTGRITDVKGVTLAGLETAMVYGPFALEGEWTHAFLNRDNRPDLDFDGFHIQATWSLTGESRASIYKISAGEFKRLKPIHSFDPASGHFGAFELAGRYSWIDLNDRDVRGGKAQVFTLGFNWYLNPNMRLMFDWSHVLDITHALGVNRVPGADAEADGLNVFQVRTQLTF